MGLCRLTYCSHAAEGLGYDDLRVIMDKSEKNNVLNGLTGLLCFGDGMFLQILEGDRNLLNRTYHRIAGDTRHTNPEIIECSEIEQRFFGEWSMKVAQLGDFAPEKVRSLILKHSSSTTFLPVAMSAQQCLNFMQELGHLQGRI